MPPAAATPAATDTTVLAIAAPAGIAPTVEVVVMPEIVAWPGLGPAVDKTRATQGAGWATVTSDTPTAGFPAMDKQGPGSAAGNTPVVGFPPWATRGAARATGASFQPASPEHEAPKGSPETPDRQEIAVSSLNPVARRPTENSERPPTPPSSTASTIVSASRRPRSGIRLFGFYRLCGMAKLNRGPDGRSDTPASDFAGWTITKRNPG